MQSLNWEDLRYFLAVARAGHLSAAARTLRVNHSTVFRRITALETTLGVRLFERLPQGYVLTAAGDHMLERVAAIDERLVTLQRRITAEDHRLTGSLKVTTTDGLGQVLLQPHLVAFHREYPDIRIELTTTNLFYNLTKRQADIAVRPTNDPPHALVGRKACSVAWAVFGATSYLQQHGRPRTAAMLAGHRILATDDSLSQLSVMQWLRRHVDEDDIVFCSNSIATLFAAARGGYGLAALPCWMGHHAPELERVLPPIEETRTAIWLLTHQDMRHTARIRAFMDFMTKALSRDPTLQED